VKVAFVVGFDNSVKAELRAKFDKELAGGSLVFFAKLSSRYSFDLPSFKSQFLKLAGESGIDPILVVAADLRSVPGLEWVHPYLEQIIGEGRSRCGSRIIDVAFCDDFQNPAPIIDTLDEFQLAVLVGGSITITQAMLSDYANGRKILCVRGNNQPCFEDALRRANIQFGNFDDYFAEMALSHTSNVSNTVKKVSKQYRCLLYSYEVLRYLHPAVKAVWSNNLYQGRTPASAVAWFKQAVQGSTKK
jgi:hypothetical protein